MNHVLERRGEEKALLDTRIAKLTKSVNKFEEKVHVLQERITEAGWKDFQNILNAERIVAEKQKNTELLEVEQIQTPILQEAASREKKRKISKLQEDESEILAEFLLQDPFLLEGVETKRLLRHLGIDIETVRQDAKLESKSAMAQLLRTFFAMDEETTVKLIDQHNHLVRHELRESTESP